MSVAFRREDDDAHKEPEYELPIPVGPNLVTERGLELIAGKEAELKAAMAQARDEEARKKLAREHRYWATQHATAQIAEAPAEGEAGIGSRVTIRRNGRTQSFRIVGHDEADPAAELLAFTAPLARAVMGAMAGELVDFGGQAESVEILSVD
ncbi:GreA/GreB family elongation factor [Stakelama tenebrarum]|uniref:Nucleoside-diphosphate kinase n=1 Tax=Stakelama tenebrarum TaxID=2711215 RepID=A0A6G6Y132_9SPHN|nr:GreA/GreB family elongation factor [Sphingosinithalassobacter tenebrarum]QIG78632.1 nucleoside-diphosphate kinase [Sphingosinithalassobacter tenebrarum]